MKEVMEDDLEENANLLESLLEKTAEYGKTSFELLKLKALDKSSDIISTIIPRSVVIALFSSFMLFLNLGLSFWLGEILGKTYYGFFVVAGFYGITGFIVYVFLHKWLKKVVSNYFIRKVLK
jgi:hypothetical protein